MWCPHRHLAITIQKVQGQSWSCAECTLGSSLTVQDYILPAVPDARRRQRLLQVRLRSRQPVKERCNKYMWQQKFGSGHSRNSRRRLNLLPLGNIRLMGITPLNCRHRCLRFGSNSGERRLGRDVEQLLGQLQSVQAGQGLTRAQRSHSQISSGVQSLV